MSTAFTQADLEAYLDEALPPDEMAKVEEELRNTPELGQQLAAIHGRRDAGVHTLGEIWRRHRLTCPSREQLTMHFDKNSPAEEAEYIQFHLEQVQCRLCTASFDDMRMSREGSEDSASRSQRLLDRSSTYLKNEE